MKTSISLILIICSTIILQGCVSAILVSTAAIITKTVIDPRTLGTQVDDSTLKVRVAKALAKDFKINKDSRIIYTVYQGKVLLTGQTPNYIIAEHAKKIVMDIDGTKYVYNEIRYGKPLSLRQVFIDILIKIKIRLKFLSSDKVKSSNVKIITENGEVFLLGIVTNNEGNAAAKLASKINGVKNVTTVFSYIQ